MAPAQKIFDYWADFQHFREFIPMIESIEVLDNIHSRWHIHAPLGHKVVFESVITTFEPGKTLVWESRHKDGFARGELRLFEENSHTRVELDYEYNLYPHWLQNLARVVNHFGFPSITFDNGLAYIKDKIESETKASS